MKCPHCGFERVIKAGKTKRKYVIRQDYRCKDCKHFFVERDGFEGRHYPKEIILQVLHLFVQGCGSTMVTNQLTRRYWIG